MKGADRIVLAEGVSVVAATTITSFAQGEGFPPPAVFLGGAAMFGGLVLLSRPAPSFAVALGGLVVVYGLLRATKPGGKSVGEILVQAVTGIGTAGFEAPGSGKVSQPTSITSVDGAAAAAKLQQQIAPASPTTPAGAVTAPTRVSTGSGIAAAVTGWALGHLNIPYSYGGGTDSGPTTGIDQGAHTIGYDCSAFVKAAWAKAGVSLPRTSQAQAQVGVAVPNLAQAQPGDLLFPTSSYGEGGVPGPGHVMLYLGNGKAAEAPQTGDVTKVIDVSGMSFGAIRRPTTS